MKTYMIHQIADLINSDELNIPKTSPDDVVPTALKIVFATAAAIAVLIITIAGLKLVLSLGNPDALTKARNAIIYASLGLLVCVSGYLIVSFVVTNL